MKKIKVLSLVLVVSLMINTMSMAVFAAETAFTAIESEQESLIETESETETETVKETEGETETETVKETEGETGAETVKETEGETETETVKETEGETETTKESETEEVKETEEEKEDLELHASLGNVTNLRAASAGKQRVRLTWNVVAGAEGYLVYAQKNGVYGYVGMTTQGTTFTDTRALDNDYNFYWVFPYVKDSNGKMQPGGCEKYVYAKGICPAVTNLKAASISNAVKLIWSAVNGADGYLVYGMNSVDSNYHYIGMTTRGTTFTDTKASTEEYNFYWVFPFHYGVNGEMIVGGTANYVYGRAKWVLSTPVITNVERDSTSQLTVEWNEVPYATQYDVYRSTSKTGGFSKIATVDSNTSLEDSGLREGTYYYYKVVALCYRDGARVTSNFSALGYERTAKEPQFSARVANTQGRYSSFAYVYINNMGTETLTVGGNAIINFALVYPYEGASYTEATLVSPTSLSELYAYNYAAGTQGTTYFRLDHQRYFSSGAHVSFSITYDGIVYMVVVDDQGKGIYQ